MNPVTLVSTVVVRKIAVKPLSRQHPLDEDQSRSNASEADQHMQQRKRRCTHSQNHETLPA